MKNEPNPNWVEAPLKLGRWTVEHGTHYAEEFKRWEADGNTIILLKLTHSDNVLIGIEEVRFPKTLKPEDYHC